MTSARNYGVIDRDAEDIADVAGIFDADWTGVGYPDLACTRLLVSPVNSRARLLSLINRAQAKLDLAVMYLADDGILAAIKQRRAAGVTVRVLLADPGWVAENRATAADLGNTGVSVRYSKTVELHAKLILAAGIPFVGSESMSFTSLNRNREIGLIVTEEGPAAEIMAQFEVDWADGVPAP